jgi:hypothetical protein
MKRTVAILASSVLLTMLMFAGSVMAGHGSWDGVPPGQENFKEMKSRFIDQGAFSYYRYGDMNFKGEYKVIRNMDDWKGFWDDHKSGILPTPDLPGVEFNKNMILVALMGNKPTACCGIGIIKVERHGNTVNAHVEKVEGPGILPVVTNPFHIIECKRAKNVNFLEI